MNNVINCAVNFVKDNPEKVAKVAKAGGMVLSIGGTIITAIGNDMMKKIEIGKAVEKCLNK